MKSREGVNPPFSGDPHEEGDHHDHDGRVVHEGAGWDHDEEGEEQKAELAGPGQSVEPAPQGVDPSRSHEAGGEDEHGPHRDGGLAGETADPLGRRDHTGQDQGQHREEPHHVDPEPVPDEEDESTRPDGEGQDDIDREGGRGCHVLPNQGVGRSLRSRGRPRDGRRSAQITNRGSGTGGQVSRGRTLQSWEKERLVLCRVRTSQAPG